jgi:hypothetical protein
VKLRWSRPGIAYAAAFVMLAAAGGVAGTLVAANGGGNGPGGNGATTDGPHSFSISGGMSDIRPGHPGVLRLTLVNPNSQDIRITQVQAVPRDAAPGCPASLLRIEPFDGSPQLVVPGKKFANIATVDLKVLLDAAAGDACKGAAFALTYAGRAEEWKGK